MGLRWDDLHVVLGSLAKPLEISNVSDILHVAAMVDLSGTYGAHRSANAGALWRTGRTGRFAPPVPRCWAR